MEHLSGIKAHTIRIWEKRYAILEPLRTDSNIRYYDAENFKKLLNVSVLYNGGLKISKIAKLSEEELLIKVREHSAKSGDPESYLGALKLSMLNFDQNLFEQTYNRLVAETSFRNIFLEIFIPFLHNIGIDWQSKNIIPAHEHFITSIIMQKLQINIERIQQIPPKHTDQVFVLYLPEKEIHEFGLLYLHYELSLNGYRSIFLGPSVPMNDLKTLQKIYKNITFVSYFTVQPIKDEVINYLYKFQAEILLDNDNKLWVLGRNAEGLEIPSKIKNITAFDSIKDLIESF